MKDRALSTLGLWVVVGLVIWVGGFFSMAEQAAFGLLALLVGAAQYEFHQLAARIPGVPRPRIRDAAQPRLVAHAAPRLARGDGRRRRDLPARAPRQPARPGGGQLRRAARRD